MKVVRKCTPTVHQRKKIPTEVVENFMKQGFPEGLMHQIVGQAIELSQADTLQAVCNFCSTSKLAWQEHKHRMYWYNKKEIGQKTAFIKGDDGMPICDDLTVVIA